MTLRGSEVRILYRAQNKEAGHEVFRDFCFVAVERIRKTEALSPRQGGVAESGSRKFLSDSEEIICDRILYRAQNKEAGHEVFRDFCFVAVERIRKTRQDSVRCGFPSVFIDI